MGEGHGKGKHMRGTWVVLDICRGHGWETWLGEMGGADISRATNGGDRGHLAHRACTALPLGACPKGTSHNQ